MTSLEALRGSVAKKFYEVGAVRFAGAGYRLAIHDTHTRVPNSPFYIDLRVLRSFPRLLYDVATLMIDAWNSHWLWGRLELVSDIPVAATPIVTVLSQRTGIPMISPRLETKTHGLGVGILGVWQPGQRVAIIDDLRTTGGSKEAVIDLYRKNGLVVPVVMVCVDRGSPEGADVKDVPLLSIYRWSELLQLYSKTKTIDDGLYRDCVGYPAELAAHLASCTGCS